jgi:hypothetical protein
MGAEVLPDRFGYVHHGLGEVVVQGLDCDPVADRDDPVRQETGEWGRPVQLWAMTPLRENDQDVAYAGHRISLGPTPSCTNSSTAL